MTHTRSLVTRYPSLATVLFCLLLYSVTSFLPPSASAQGGTPPFSSLSGGPEIINNFNLNTHWTIPVLHKAGRGLAFDFNLVYDSSFWNSQVSTGLNAWLPSSNFGWGTGGTDIGRVTYTVTNSTTHCFIKGQQFSAPQTTWSNWVYTDGGGTSHSFPGSAIGTGAQCSSSGQNETTGFSNPANDGSGYTLNVNGDCCAIKIDSIQVISPTGNQINPSTPSVVSGNIQDTNGNVITSDGQGHLTDTLGTLAITIAGAAPNPVTYTYTAPSGANAAYTVEYTNFTVASNFGLSNIHEYKSPAAVPLVTSIVLPDGSQYSFTYEPTPATPTSGACTPYSGTTCTTARLASVTLPTGGTISYAHYNASNNFPACTTGSNGILSDTTPSCLQRITPDGTWAYTRALGTSPDSTTTIVDPQGNNTSIQFVAGFPAVEQVYQGAIQSSNLLQTTSICYNGITSNCATTYPGSEISQRAATIQLGPSGLQCKHVTFYDAGPGTIDTGHINEQDDYDYGSGAPGPLLRKVLYQYGIGSNAETELQTVTIQNGTGTQVAETSYSYDETSVTATSGTPQHNSVTVNASRHNVTTIKSYTTTTNFLTKKTTYFDTGNPQTTTDVNGAQTTYAYGACGNSFPTSIAEPLSLSKSMTWNCTGGAMTSFTDENTQATSTTYNDGQFWRPASATDPTNAVATFTYNGQAQAEVSMSFNSGNSIVDKLTTLDSLGRPHLAQVREGPGDGNYDSTETDYDAIGRPSRSTAPYVGTAGQTDSSQAATTTAYDALNRPLTVTDGGAGTVSYSYSNNDVLITVGPAPSGENTKRRQLEYDALGRLTSVCEITSASGSGTCGQTLSQTGYWTKYTYDALGNLTGVTQNAQSGSQQTRNYTYDAISRLTSEKNPEVNQTSATYTYDTDSTCGTSSGDLVKKVDAVGNVTCTAYDAPHRPTSITYPSGSYASVTPAKHFVYDSATVNSVAMTNVKGRLAEAYTCTGSCSSKITDEGFSYTVRGEASDAYESTPNSGGYYHLTQTYWANGLPNGLSGLPGLPMITYSPDGEGRARTVGASSGQNPVTGTIYTIGTLAFKVTFGSGDSDNFSYDGNTLRMTQFKFNVGTQSKYLNGQLTWNPNGSLGQLAITDQFNSADTQTCNYSHDDLSRIATANCGMAANQTFSYDPFGNISKAGSPYTFQPSYSASTNRMTSIAGFTPTYDNNGNVTNDSNHTYTWDADGNSTMVDSVGLTFDALDRVVEQNRSGTHTQIVYDPGGGKLALMSGQTLQKAFVPLPGQATAVYTSAGLDHYRHSDWLGSARLTSSPTQSTGFLSSVAYAPFGETYASSGTTDLSFTGMNPDTVSSDYDFLFRPYSTQGRWPTPDPAGLAAVDPSNPQSWNRYAYVLNNPLASVDPLGLDCVYLNDDGTLNHIVPDDCSSENDNGYYVDGKVTGIIMNDGQVTGVLLNNGNDVQPVGFDYNSSSSSSPDSSGQFAPIVPFVNPLASLLNTFVDGPVGRTFQNANNLLGCTSNAIVGEIPFVGKYLSNSPDPVGNKLRSAGNAISPNPEAKTLGLIPNNLAVNTQRVVTTLDKLDLPQLSEAAAAASSKFAPYAPFASKALGIAGAAYMAGNAGHNAYSCYQANKGTTYLP